MLNTYLFIYILKILCMYNICEGAVLFLKGLNVPRLMSFPYNGNSRFTDLSLNPFSKLITFN